MLFQSAFFAAVVLTASLVIADDSFDESKAIEKIELLGGKIMRDATLPGQPVVGVSFSEGKRFSEKYLHLLKSFRNLKWLNLMSFEVTDSGLEQINDLKQSFPNIRLLYNDPKEAPAIREIEKLGGQLERNHGLPGNPVVGVSFPGRNPHFANNKFDDDQLLLLDSFTHLIKLSLPYTVITDDGLKRTTGLRNLQALNLMATKITDAGLKEIIGAKDLTHVELQRTEITDDGLRELGELKTLTSLNLSECTQITDAGLKELPNFDELDLSFCTQITDAGIKEVIRRKNLIRLNLNKTAITDVGLADVKELKNLTDLRVSDTGITDTVLKDLSDLKNLKTLFFAKTKITDVGLKHLVALTNLTTLDLSLTQITDVGLNELNELKHLKTLFVSETPVTDEGVKKLKNASPNLNIFR